MLKKISVTVFVTLMMGAICLPTFILANQDDQVDQSLNTIEKLPFGAPVPPTGKLPELDQEFGDDPGLDPFVDGNTPEFNEPPIIPGEPPPEQPSNEECTSECA